jgi:hypothetical protein
MAVGQITQGRRVRNFEHFDFRPGDYGVVDGKWYCRAPLENDNHRLQGNLTRHEVIEHKDGTITVSPSILISAGDGSGWHGYLERGIWREV